VNNIEVPSKWDIIPIHASDRGTFKSCRRQWAWSSPSRLNLIPRVQAHGIREYFWFGTGIHLQLQGYYGVPSIDPVDGFEAWFQLEWKGGLIHETELDQYADRLPIPGPQKGTYWIKGLSELLPDAELKADNFEQYRLLGRGMMEFYKEYAPRYDDFEVIQLEHLFSVPVLDPEGNAMYAADTRKMPEDWEPNFKDNNAYGPLMVEGTGGLVKQVHARGKMDVVAKIEDGFIIRDYKTASKVDDDYFRHLDLDEQCTTYLTLAEREARMYGLPYTEIDYIDYVALRKAFPTPPTITQRGLPSLDRQKESTTAEMFEAAIKELNLDIWLKNDVKAKSYYDYLVSSGDRQFIWPERVRRNKMQKQNSELRLFYEARDMLDPDLVLYPNPRKEYPCLNCIFRSACIAAEDGSDWQGMLDTNFIPNYDR